MLSFVLNYVVWLLIIWGLG